MAPLDLYAVARRANPALPEDGRASIREALDAHLVVSLVLQGEEPIGITKAQREAIKQAAADLIRESEGAT